MSSTAFSASDTIEVKGTISGTGALGAGGGLVILFCANSPLIGASCTAPTGMAVAASPTAGGSTAGTASKISNNAIKFAATGALANSSSFDFTVSGLTNPDGTGLTNGTFYARLATYDTSDLTGATDDASTGVKDTGAVALSVADTVGVTADVLESMTFCVFGDPNNNTASANGTANDASYLAAQTTNANGPANNCDDSAHGNKSPSVQLGQVNSNVSALSTSAVSYAAEWAQLSTNASSGAVVYLKTSNSCVGLHRTSASAGTCDIPSTDGTGTASGSLTVGTAGFGLSFGTAVSSGTGSTGSVELNSNYSGHYAMLGSGSSPSSGQATENGHVQDTTSTYGGFVFGSAGAPVSNYDIPFSIGASIGNNTPAGSYAANLNLIAVGTY